MYFAVRQDLFFLQAFYHHYCLKAVRCPVDVFVFFGLEMSRQLTICCNGLRDSQVMLIPSILPSNEEEKKNRSICFILSKTIRRLGFTGT
jgi:hypothetical protein